MGIKNPFLSNNREDNPTAQENRVAKKLGGFRKVRSGAHRASGIYDRGNGYAGDVSIGRFEVECKITEKRSMSLKAEWLERMAIGAKPKNRSPAIQVTFKNLDSICEKDWIMIELSVFRELIGIKDDN